MSDLGHEIFRTILHPDDNQRRMENLEVCKQLADEKEAEVEVRMKIADGSWNWFRIRDKFFKRKPDGSVSQIIEIAQDIHQQKTADERLYKSPCLSGARNKEL